MIRKVSPLNAAFLGIRKPATKVSNNMNKMFANASGLRKRKVWNLKQKLSSNFSQSFLCDVAEFKEKTEKESELKRWGRAAGLMATGGIVAPIGGIIGGTSGYKLGVNLSGTHKKTDRVKAIKTKLYNKYQGETPDRHLNRLRQYNRKLIKRQQLFSNAGFLVGALAGGTLAGAGTYGAYRAGKSLMNKLRNKNKKVK